MKIIVSKKHCVFYSLPKTVKDKYTAEVHIEKIFMCRTVFGKLMERDHFRWLVEVGTIEVL